MEESNNNIETKKIVTCRNCGTILRDDALFCHECGQSKDGPWFCYNCKSVLQENQKFCPSCGTRVGPDSYKIKNVIEPEKRLFELNESNNKSSIKTSIDNVNDNVTIGNIYSGKGKSKIVAVLLSLFLGAFSADLFYLGYKNKGLLKLCLLLPYFLIAILKINFYNYQLAIILTTISILCFVVCTIIWPIVDIFLIVFEKMKPADGIGYKDGMDRTVAATVNTVKKSINNQ